MDSLTHGSFIWLEAVCAERNVARRYTVALSHDLFGASIVEFPGGGSGPKGRGGRSRSPARMKPRALRAGCCTAGRVCPNGSACPAARSRWRR